MRKTLAALLCMCLLLSPALASGEPSGGASGAGTPAFTVSDDGLETDGSLAVVEKAPGAVVSAEEISGVRVVSDANDAGGVSFTAEEGRLRLGGEADCFDVTTVYTGETRRFNTVIDLREPDGYVWGTDSSGGAAIAVRGRGEVDVENVYARNTGVGRYTVNLSRGTTIIKNSYFENTGCDGAYCDMPWFTAQLGNSRNLIACGTLSAYIYNSTVATEGFGSWSTDTGGNPYVFYLYNGDAHNVFGGYGTYADTGLNVHIYGSRFDSAQYGAFLANTGVLNLASSADAAEAEDEIFLENLRGQELPEDTPTELVANQNAIVIHVVDTMRKANPETGVKDSAVSPEWKTTPILNAKNSLLSTEGALYECTNRFPVLQQAWLDHLKGSTVVFRGACGTANLENVRLASSSGVLIHSCVDLDESSVQILDDVATEDIPGCVVNSVNNTWTGDIVNEDYQRPMYLDLRRTVLTGAILTYDCAHWNALFAGYADMAYTVDPATGLYVNAADPAETASNFRAVDPTSIYGWLCAFPEYNAVRGTFLTMDKDSVWNVAAESRLNGLTLAPGAVVNGTVTVDGTAVDVSSGGSWTGEIVITPSAAGSASGGPSGEIPPERPADLGPSDEPPGGFGGID